MASLTDLLGTPIRDPGGDAVANLSDLVVRVPTGDPQPGTPTVDLYPPVIGLVARLKGPRGHRDVFIPWEKVAHMGTDGVTLSSPSLNLQTFAKRDGEMVLHGGLFDKQVVDVEGRRVVRINDLDLGESNGTWRLLAADVGVAGLVRQLPFGKRLSARIAKTTPLIDWAMVVPVLSSGANSEEGDAVRLRVPRDRLATIRPADLAQLMEELTPQESASLLENMDEAHAADTLEELEDEQQAQILRAMDKERAADVLEEMEPDEAADALQGVSEEEKADLLRRMDHEEAEEVRELLGYPEDSAGGIMTTDYISVPEWASVGEVMAALRTRARAAELDTEDPLPAALPEIYVVAEERPPMRPLVRRNGAKPRGKPGPNAAAATIETARGPLPLEAEGRLLGVVPLRDLLLAEPEARIVGVMKPAEIVAHPLEGERDVARLIADEDLVALPIVDDEGKMLGIVTVDDAIDVILPTAWKKRIPRRYR